MTELANEDFWTTVGTVATRARVRRMLDVEFVSELFILTMHGIQDGKASLDRYYAAYDDEIPRKSRTNASLGSYPIPRRLASRLALHSIQNLADLYSLWAAIQSLDKRESLPDAEQAAARLAAFEARVIAGEDDQAQRYLIAARQGSNKDTNREFRKQLIEDALEV